MSTYREHQRANRSNIIRQQDRHFNFYPPSKVQAVGSQRLRFVTAQQHSRYERPRFPGAQRFQPQIWPRFPPQMWSQLPPLYVFQAQAFGNPSSPVGQQSIRNIENTVQRSLVACPPFQSSAVIAHKNLMPFPSVPRHPTPAPLPERENSCLGFTVIPSINVYKLSEDSKHFFTDEKGPLTTNL